MSVIQLFFVDLDLTFPFTWGSGVRNVLPRVGIRNSLGNRKGSVRMTTCRAVEPEGGPGASGAEAEGCSGTTS